MDQLKGMDNRCASCGKHVPVGVVYCCVKCEGAAKNNVNEAELAVLMRQYHEQVGRYNGRSNA